MVVYGVHAVVEALRAGRVERVLVGVRDDRRLRDIVDEAARRGVALDSAPREALDRAARGGVHQGVVAYVAARNPVSLADLARTTAGHLPLIVVLDGVEDPQNLGAILRSVDAAGGSGIVRQTRHAAPLAGAAARTSAGAVHHVAVAEVVNIARALETLKEAGVWTVGLDAAAETRYYDLDLTLPTALVVGAEGHGLRRLVRERCDFVAAIPLVGHVGSLNVSAATAVVLFEAVRQRQVRGSSGPTLPR